MLTSDKTDDRRSAATPEPCDGATYVAEASTAEEALADVHAQLGASARIIEARRLPRGGIGGFFAKETVQIHAAPPAHPAGAARADATRAEAPAGAPPAPAAGAPPAPATGIASPVDRLLEGADTTDDTVDFATFLRRQIGRSDDAEQVLAPGHGRVGHVAERPEGHAASMVSWPRIDEPSGTGPDVVTDRDVTTDRVVTTDRDVDTDRDVTTDRDVDTAVAESAHGDLASSVDWAALRGLLAEAQRAIADAERQSAGVGQLTSPPVGGPGAGGRDAPAPGVAAPRASVASSQAASVVSGTPDLPSAGDPPATDDDDGPCWSVTSLLRVGLPAELVRSLTVNEPHDDTAWTMALATALRPLCRPLPAGRSLLVGPRARARAHRLQVPIVEPGEPIVASGDVAAVVGKSVARRQWIVEHGARGRWVHVLAGGSGWRRLLHAADPLAVSWATADDLADAIRCAVELGLVLGSGPLGGRIRRARPLDLALAVRAQMVTP